MGKAIPKIHAQFFLEDRVIEPKLADDLLSPLLIFLSRPPVEEPSLPFEFLGKQRCSERVFLPISLSMIVAQLLLFP